MTNTQLPSCSHTTKHAILCVSFLLLLSRARAQPGTNGSPADFYGSPRFSPSLAIIIVVLVAVLFIMGFFSVYIRHCSEVHGDGGSIRRLGASMRRRAATRGLDAQVIGTFPTFEYSAVKGLKIGKGALECAVCLNEFEDNETLRLIPKCDHVFHPECIDAWLTSHVTCPVCRANLVPQPGEILQVPDLEPESNELEEIQNPDVDQVSIQVVDENQEQEQTVPDLRQPSVKQNRPPRSRSVRSRLFGKFPRSHSTGHSLIQPGENTDRFTLRLPEDVRKKMMSRALNRTNSCVVVLPRESSSRRGYRLGEGSSRGGRSFGRSDRWTFSMAPPFFSRTLSVRSPKVMADDGEGSTSSRTPRGTKTAVKLSSFKYLESNVDQTGLVPAESVRPPV